MDGRTKLLLCILLSINYIRSDVYNNNYCPLLVGVIMVKNEAAVIEATLKPFVDGGVDAFFVFDTGSTDQTIEVTQGFFQHYNIIHGYIEQEDFIDFATSRNHALQRAQKLFPHAAFMIMFDAEWYINDARALIDFCHRSIACGDRYATYLIRILNDYADFYTPRLIRCHSNVLFVGKVHETIVSQTRVKVPRSIYFQYLPAAYGTEKTQKRYVQDRTLLYQEYNKNPSDTRTLFYLAMTCHALGSLEEAYFLYKKRITLKGFDEEDFMSYYRLAQTIQQLSEQQAQYSWSEAFYYYLCAYNMRSGRAEPLVAIERYYQMHHAVDRAFLYTFLASSMPYPQHDILFIEKNVYKTIV